jgi:hypothetical protein
VGAQLGGDPRVERWDRLTGLRPEAPAPEFEVERSRLLRGNRFFAVLKAATGEAVEVELGPDMVGRLHEGDRVRLGPDGIEIIGR